jgi:hypothetical protein
LTKVFGVLFFFIFCVDSSLFICPLLLNLSFGVLGFFGLWYAVSASFVQEHEPVAVTIKCIRGVHFERFYTVFLAEHVEFNQGFFGSKTTVDGMIDGSFAEGADIG